MQYGPNPNAIYPNEAIKSVCFIKNTITRPNIIVGEYSYYDDVNGAIIAANSVVTKSVPAYHIAGGNPCRIIRKRFNDELIAYLQEIKWWNWSPEKIFANLETLCSGDLQKIKSIPE